MEPWIYLSKDYTGTAESSCLEPVTEADGTRVIVTWVRSGRPVNLRDRGIDETRAADLRRRFEPPDIKD